MTGGEQGTALGQLVEADQQDVNDKCNQQQQHNVGEALAEDFLDTCGNSVLAVVGVDDTCGQVEAVLQTGQDGTEVVDQAAGTDVQDQHADDGLQGAAQGVVPLFLLQQVADQDQEADHVGSLLQNVGGEECPNCVQNCHKFFLLSMVLRYLFWVNMVFARGIAGLCWITLSFY